MIGKHLDGSITDTDKLNDMSALIVEEVKRFTDFMCEHKVPFFMHYLDLVRKTRSGSQNFNESYDNYAQLLSGMNSFFETHKLPHRIVRYEDYPHLFDKDGNRLPCPPKET